MGHRDELGVLERRKICSTGIQTPDRPARSVVTLPFHVITVHYGAVLSGSEVLPVTD